MGRTEIRPTDYERAVVIDTGPKKSDQTKRSLKRTMKFALKQFERAGVVRDVR
jgi:hypothetical protein